MRKVLLLLSCLSFLCFHNALPVVYGSETLVSVIPYVTFPASDSDNTCATFGFFRNGFSLQDNTTTCTFQSVYPLSGQLSLHGGQLYLNNDLYTQNILSFGSSGYFRGNGHVFDLAESVTGIPTTFQTVFDSTNISLNADLNVTGTLLFKGNCTIYGSTYRLLLGAQSAIIVDTNSSLLLKNIGVDGVARNNVCCVDNSGQVILDDVYWVQTGNYTFTQGSILFQNTTEMLGGFNFLYTSCLTSTIASASTIYAYDLITMSLGRQGPAFGREPFYFTDETSVLRFENSTLNITSSGMNLTRGTLICDREVELSIDSTNTTYGLSFGDGNAADDLTFVLMPGAAFELTNGALIYDVVTAPNFVNNDVAANFGRRGNSIFYVKQSINFANVLLDADFESQVILDPGVNFYDTNVTLAFPGLEYIITGYRGGAFYDILPGNGSLQLLSGDDFFGVKIFNTGNTVFGAGNFSGPIIFANALSGATIALNGKSSGGIILNGGQLTLGADLILDQSALVTGTGTVYISSYQFQLPPQDVNWTNTIVFNGDGGGGGVNLNADMTISSSLIFSGQCTLNANNNIMRLTNMGYIVVDRNSQLYIKDANIAGVGDSNILCVDDSSSIIFDNVKLLLNNNYTFSQGSFEIVDNVDFIGSYSFFYQSNLTSTIASNSMLTLSNNLTLSTGRISSTTARQPLYFQDATAWLNMNGANLMVNQNGMAFTRGTMSINKNVLITIASATNGFTIGDGTSQNDFSFIWNAGSTLVFPKGVLVYDNINPLLIQPRTNNSAIVVSGAFSIHVNQNLLFENLNFQFNSVGSGPVVQAGKTFGFNNVTFLFPFLGTEYNLTGTFDNRLTNLLGGNGQLIAITGAIPQATLVKGQNNSILGSGALAAPVTLNDGGTQALLSLNGVFGSNIIMHGSEATLGAPATFADNTMFTGSGTINFSNSFVDIGGPSLLSTSTLYWNSSGSYIILRSDLSLSAQWTFSGNITVLGSNNSLILRPAGQIIVERGSSVIFKDITFDGISADVIQCNDSAGKITFDNVVWFQNSNYSFSCGQIIIENDFTISGVSSVFAYQSNEPATINAYANLILDRDITFSYDPGLAGGNNNLIVFTNETSKLIIQDATLYAGRVGWQLTNGTLEINGLCFIEGDLRTQSNGLILGDGTSQDDMMCFFGNGSLFNLTSGSLTYNNVLDASWDMRDTIATLKVSSGTILSLNQTLDLGPGNLLISSSALLNRAVGVNILGSVSFF